MDLLKNCLTREERHGRQSSGRPSLSKRADDLLAHPNAILDLIKSLLGDLYGPDNPDGILNIGIAENSLMHEWLTDYFNSHFKISYQDFTYGDTMNGSKRLFAALCRLLNKRFAPVEEVKPSHLIAGVGASAVIDQLTMMTCDPGDGVMTVRPVYNGFFNDVSARVGAQLVCVTIPDGVAPDAPATLDAFEAEFAASTKRGIKPRVVLLCNPQNPLGFCYPRETVLAYMKFAERHNLHLIVDEIYALSVFEPTEQAQTERHPFISALSIDAKREAGCDPSRVHVVYGMSKDFCSNGLRIGIAVSQHNKQLIKAFEEPVILMKVSSTSDLLWSRLLDDEEALEQFLSENRKRLAQAYDYSTAWLRKWGIPWRASYAGHFIWIDMREFLPTHDKDGKKLDTDADREQALFLQLLREAKVYLAPGMIYASPVAGMFRLTFPTRRDYLDKAFGRLDKFLESARARHVRSGGEALGVEELQNALNKLGNA